MATDAKVSTIFQLFHIQMDLHILLILTTFGAKEGCYGKRRCY